ATRAHHVVPFLPTEQDECTFGDIGLVEYRAIRQDMAARFDPAKLTPPALTGEERKAYLRSLLPTTTDNATMLANVHALARAMGAQLDAVSHQSGHTRYGYRLDVNELPHWRSALFNWAVIDFVIADGRGEGLVSVDDVWVLLPTFNGPFQATPRERSCPLLSGSTGSDPA
ncbi:MAG: hypothetical protein AAF637_28175, partial [Pseudomonadota bacterium]